MRDPLTWSFPVAKMFGVAVRGHITLPVVFFGLILRSTALPNAPGGVWLDAIVVMLLYAASLLWHECGHALTARIAGGRCDELMLWPAGGLLICDMPHSPRGHVLTAFGGIAATAMLCLVSLTVLLALGFAPPLNPFDVLTNPYFPKLAGLHGDPPAMTEAAKFAARVFTINWALFLVNLIPAYPLDAGNALAAGLWWRSGEHRQSLSTAAYAGLVAMLAIGITAIAVNEILLGLLAVFVYLYCRQQLVTQEPATEETPFGYDFSQGYTSLEREPPAASNAPRRPPLGFWQRWKLQRAARQMRLEQSQREAEEKRLEELLEKVHAKGLQALTEEERRFMTRVSARYRNKP